MDSSTLHICVDSQPSVSATTQDTDLVLVYGRSYLLDQSLDSPLAVQLRELSTASVRRVRLLHALQEGGYKELQESSEKDFPQGLEHFPIIESLVFPASYSMKDTVARHLNLSRFIPLLSESTTNTCPLCGSLLDSTSPESMFALLSSENQDSLYSIESPLYTGNSPSFTQKIVFQFGSVRLNGELREAEDLGSGEEAIEILSNPESALSVIVDQLRFSSKNKERALASLSEAASVSGGEICVWKLIPTGSLKFRRFYTGGQHCLDCEYHSASLNTGTNHDPQQETETPPLSLLEFFRQALKASRISEQDRATLKRSLHFVESLSLENLLLNIPLEKLCQGEMTKLSLLRYYQQSIPGELRLLVLPFFGIHPLEFTKIVQIVGEMNGDDAISVLIDPAAVGVKLDGQSQVQRIFPRQKKRSLPPTTNLTSSSSMPHIVIRPKAGSPITFPRVGCTVVTGDSSIDARAFVFERLVPLFEGRDSKIKSSNSAQGWSIDFPEPRERMHIFEQGKQYSRFTSVLRELDLATTLYEFFASLPWAKIRGLQARDFRIGATSQFNCSNCRGLGWEVHENESWTAQVAPCEQCEGYGFEPTVLQTEYRSLNFKDTLQLTLSETKEYFGFLKNWSQRIDFCSALGLENLKLSYPVKALSSSEQMRLTLARHVFAKKPTSVFLDTPSFGMSLEHCEKFSNVLRNLAHDGHLMVLLDNHPTLVAQADYVIELTDFDKAQDSVSSICGNPQQLMKQGSSLTKTSLKMHYDC